MHEVLERTFSLFDQEEVIKLWDLCGLTKPWNDPIKDIKRKTDLNDNCFFVFESNNKIIGTVMIGYDGHRGNVYYFCVHPDFQRKNIGSKIMNKVEEILKGMNCPKVNIMVRSTNLKVTNFYESLEYKKEDTIILGKRLIHDN